MNNKTVLLFLILTVFLLFSCNLNSSDNVSDYTEYPFMIGNTKYLTLQDAIAAIPKNSKNSDNEPTIKLIRNTSDKGAVIDRDVTLDFGNYIFTLSFSDIGIMITDGTEVNIKGGLFNAERNSNVSQLINNKGNLLIDNSSIDLSETSLNAIQSSSGSIEITGYTTITTCPDRFIFELSGVASVSVTSPNAILAGSLSFSGLSKASFGKSELKLSNTPPT